MAKTKPPYTPVFRRRIAAPAGVALGLAEPVSDRLSRRFKLLREPLGGVAGAQQHRARGVARRLFL
jgi:hypothetical protein